MGAFGSIIGKFFDGTLVGQLFNAVAGKKSDDKKSSTGTKPDSYNDGVESPVTNKTPTAYGATPRNTTPPADNK